MGADLAAAAALPQKKVVQFPRGPGAWVSGPFSLTGRMGLVLALWTAQNSTLVVLVPTNCSVLQRTQEVILSSPLV